MDIIAGFISFRSVLVLGGLCFLALIVSVIADRKHDKKTKAISDSLGIFLMVATLCMTSLWIVKVGIHGVRYLAHD